MTAMHSMISLPVDRSVTRLWVTVDDGFGLDSRYMFPLMRQKGYIFIQCSRKTTHISFKNLYKILISCFAIELGA